jgi:hypothetical protein
VRNYNLILFVQTETCNAHEFGSLLGVENFGWRKHCALGYDLNFDPLLFDIR